MSNSTVQILWSNLINPLVKVGSYASSVEVGVLSQGGGVRGGASCL